MKAEKTKVQKIKPIKTVYSIFVALLILVVVLALVGTSYAYSYKDKVLLNSYLLNKNIAGLNSEELGRVIDSSESDYKDKKIKIVYEDKRWEIDYSDFNWAIDKEKTVEKILGTNRARLTLNSVIASLKSLAKKQKYDLSYSFNQAALLDWISKINSEVGEAKEETNIVIKNDNVKITEPKVGKKINEEQIRLEILDRLALKKSGEIKIELTQDEPLISKEEAEKLIERAKALTESDAKLIGPNGSIIISKETLGTSIKLKKENRKSGFLKSELGDAYVSFDDSKIQKLLQEEIEKLNIAAEDAKFTISDGKVSLISPSKSGKEIKLDESVNLVVKSLERNTKEIKLPVQDQEPSINAQSSSDIERIGIKELIGTATTDFRKSPQNRVHNIKTGVKYISGAVVKPDAEFSTISRLGTIDQSTGYLPELVIKENATVPEFGGGLCQVSTTLFRAAMNSGLEITERQNHSYRVSYYEPPVGMDATIYYPRPDFKFKNTTDNYVLIYGYVEGTKITFDIYGTKDGRTVEVTDPEVYDISSPPEPIYTDDPTLEPGEIRQTDSAHPGAKAIFYYTVKKGDQVINKQTFKSAYVPWPAKFLRGPGTSPEQQAEQQSE